MGRGRCRVDVSVDGRFVAAGCGDGAVYVWDEGSRGRRLTSSSAAAGGGGGPTATVLRGGHKEAVVAAVFNCDVSALATADKGGVVAFWSLMGQA